MIQHTLKNSMVRFSLLDFLKTYVQIFFMELYGLALVTYTEEVITNLYRLYKTCHDSKYNTEFRLTCFEFVK